MNDSGSALDDGLDVGLVLVDLSSGFDTVDHQILLGRLQFKYGMSGSILSPVWKVSDYTYRQNKLIPETTQLWSTTRFCAGPPIKDTIDAHGLH